MSQQPTVEEVEDVGTLRAFTKDERAFLRKHVEQYRTANGAAERKLLTGTVAKSFLTKFFPTISGYERTSAKRMIKTFFANNNRKTSPGAKFWNKVMSRRDVAYRLYREEFNDWCGGAKSLVGDNGRVDLGKLQRKFSRFLETLTPEQNAEITTTWKSWEENQYPEHIQVEYHRKYGVRFNMASDHSAFTKMGEYRLTLIIAPAEDGRLETTWSDNIPSFVKFEVDGVKEHFPAEWDRLYGTWRRYAVYLQDAFDKANGVHIPDHLPSRLRPQPRGEIKLPVNEQGFPIMPPVTAAMTGAHCLRLMRTYLNAQYTLARGGILSKAPVKLIADHPEMLAPGSLPPGFLFRDISQLHAHETRAFCEHVHMRQETASPDNVFRFTKIMDGRTGNVLIPPQYIRPGEAANPPPKQSRKRAPRAKVSRAAPPARATGSIAPPQELTPAEGHAPASTMDRPGDISPEAPAALVPDVSEPHPHRPAASVSGTHAIDNVPASGVAAPQQPAMSHRVPDAPSGRSTTTPQSQGRALAGLSLPGLEAPIPLTADAWLTGIAAPDTQVHAVQPRPRPRAIIRSPPDIETSGGAIRSSCATGGPGPAINGTQETIGENTATPVRATRALRRTRTIIMSPPGTPHTLSSELADAAIVNMVTVPIAGRKRDQPDESLIIKEGVKRARKASKKENDREVKVKKSKKS